MCNKHTIFLGENRGDMQGDDVWTLKEVKYAS